MAQLTDDYIKALFGDRQPSELEEAQKQYDKLYGLRYLSVDFNPGHDSHAKDSPVRFAARFDIETAPDDWEFEGWGIYTSVRPLITDEKWQEICEKYYEGMCNSRGARSFRKSGNQN